MYSYSQSLPMAIHPACGKMPAEQDQTAVIELADMQEKHPQTLSETDIWEHEPSQKFDDIRGEVTQRIRIHCISGWTRRAGVVWRQQSGSTGEGRERHPHAV